jgi:aspartate/methionine/tyrosine aminotransferase
MDGSEFVRQLLRVGVVATPGEAFGKSGKNYVRFSATQSTDKIIKATKRIEEFALEKAQKTTDH